MDISLIIPCYNEEENVDVFFQNLKKSFAVRDFHTNTYLLMMAVLIPHRTNW